MAHRPTESDTCRDYVLPRLLAAGWTSDQIVEQYPITDGRIITIGRSARRQRSLRADYVLEYTPGVPVAIVEAKRQDSRPEAGLQQSKRYAAMLDVHLAYATNGTEIIEDDRHTGLELDRLQSFPSPSETWKRHQGWRNLSANQATGLIAPFNRQIRALDGRVKEPRYYQRVAINRAVEEITSGKKRLLLTLATGTGKTFVSLQIVWKLWSSDWIRGRKPRVLYLADRRILIDQPMSNDFIPAFGEGPTWKLQGAAQLGREIYFGLYQALADRNADSELYRQFPPDFFDLVIVDECHRGSANDSSSWRAILEYFSSATQLGMTATPKRDETADTYAWFGEPIFQYSLAQGIEDGFLAPYRVRRVVLSPDAHGWEPSPGELDYYGRQIPDGLYTTRHFERVVSLLSRTEAAARHLCEHLANTDPLAKTIVFCVDQEHADQMRRAIHNNSRSHTQRFPDYVVRIVSDEGDVGRSHLARFSDPESETPVVVTTSQLLSTGVDIPTVKNIVIFRPIGSMPLFKQIIGRGTRLYPDADKLSFDILDYSGATALFEDREFDGPPERVTEEVVDYDGSTIDEGELPRDGGASSGTDTITPSSNNKEHPLVADQTTVDPSEIAPRRKLYVDGGEIWITADALYQLDPLTERLQLVEYRSYVADAVRGMFANSIELQAEWVHERRRTEVQQSLNSRGIDISHLAEGTGLTTADPLDILVHLAWNQPLATRADRVRRVKREHQEFFDKFRPEAREVLNEILSTYQDYGADELADLRVLQIPPLSNLGTPTELASRFDGGENLRDAFAELRTRLYAA